MKFGHWLQHGRTSNTLSQISQTHKDKCVTPHMWGSLIGKFVETESRIEDARNWGGRTGELVFSGYRMSVGVMKNSGDGDGCSTLWMSLMSVNCTLKDV